MATKKNEETAEATEATQSKEKLVKIRLPLIPGVQNQEALFVGCNERSWVIPRGEEMEVPECVVEIIQHSENSMYAAYKFTEQHATE